jgi:uncharacterized membrane protein
MEALAALFALAIAAVLLATPVFAIWATIAVRRERRERAELEQRLRRLEWQLGSLGRHEPERALGGETASAPFTRPLDSTPASRSEPAPDSPAEAVASFERTAAEAVSPPDPGSLDPWVATRPIELADLDAGPAPHSDTPKPPSPAPETFPPPEGEPATPAPPRISWEERLATRLPIWLGAIALVLAGAFLVKFSIDRGLLGPAVRVALGLTFGVVLLGLGEWLRRRDDRIAQACSAAGVAVLFVVVWAATALWGLLPAAGGFVFLALVTAVGVALSLRQGVIVAIVGLVGGLLAPALAGSGPDRPAVLFGYLLLLCVAILAVSGRRGWSALAAVALGGTLVWTLVWLAGVAGTVRAAATPVVALFLVLLALAFIALAPRRELGAGKAGVGVLGGAALVTTLFAAALTTGIGHQGPWEWAALGLLAAATLVLARFDVRFIALPWLALVVVLGALTARLGRISSLLGASSEADESSSAAGLALAAQLDPGVLPTIIVFFVLFGLGGYLAHRGAARPTPFLALVSVSTVLLTMLGLAAAHHLGHQLPEGAVVLAVGVILVLAAIPVASQRREGVAWATGGLGALAAGASACAALAVPLELERAWISVGWALEAFALVWLGGRLALPLLRRLGLLAAAGVGVRLLLNPMVLEYPTGEHPVLSWVLYGYGIPILAAIAAARSARATGAWRSDAALLVLGLGLTAAWWALSVRQFHHPGDLDASRWYFSEWGALASGWLALGLLWRAPPGFWMAGDRHRLGGRLIAGAGLATALFGPVLAANPSHTGELVSFGLLVLAYLVPAALLLALAHLEAHAERRSAMALWGTGALLLVWVGITQLVRFGFRGSQLTGQTSGAEGFAISAAWIGLGIALLVVGVRISSRPARYAALAVMGLAAAKVFLVDVGGLQDLWRVASFLGLGASLLVLAGVYRKFVLGTAGAEPRDAGSESRETRGGGGGTAAGVVLLLLGFGTADRGVASDQGQFEVDQPGPALVVVPTAWLEDGPPRLRVFGPSGAELATELHDRGSLPQPLAVAIRSVSRSGDGWALEVETPAAPDSSHTRCSAGLELDLGTTRVVLDEVVVEGRDGTSWRPLARGPIFRLDAAAGSQTTSLSWPPSGASALRILLPGASSDDAPDVRSIALATCRAPNEGFELTLETVCQRRGAVLECEAPLPERRVTDLELVLETSPDETSELAWRVSTGRFGRWRRLGEGLGLGPDGRLRVGLGTNLDGAVRVEVGATAATTGTLLARGPGLVLALDATEVGAYRVRREPGRGTSTPSPASSPRVRWFHLELAPSVLPTGTPIEGASLDGRFSTSWLVRPSAGEPTPGSALRLELPPAVLAIARFDLGDLRLASGDRQIPYRRETLARAAWALEAENVAPTAGRTTSQTEIELAVDEPGQTLSALELRAAGPFERSVRLVELVPDRPGVPGSRRQLAAETFRCDHTGPLPCSLSLALELRSPVALLIELEDGDSAPLAAVSARLARRREALVFAHPAGDLRLLAGDPALGAPRYDDVLLRRLEAPAMAVLGPATPTAADTSGRDRWILLAALGLAAVALAVVLRRQLG